MAAMPACRVQRCAPVVVCSVDFGPFLNEEVNNRHVAVGASHVQRRGVKKAVEVGSALKQPYDLVQISSLCCNEQCFGEVDLDLQLLLQRDDLSRNDDQCCDTNYHGCNY